MEYELNTQELCILTVGKLYCKALLAEREREKEREAGGPKKLCPKICLKTCEQKCFPLGEDLVANMAACLYF